MSITAIVWAILFCIAVVGAWVNPIFGLFGYLLEYFQRPALYWWGRELPDLRWNFTIAAITAAAYLLRKDFLPPMQRTTHVALLLLILQAINTTIVSTWAVWPTMSWTWSIQYWKLVVVFVFFSSIIRTPQMLAYTLLFQIVGAAWWGWDALDEKRLGSRLEQLGSGDTKNANMLAGHLLTIIPTAVIFSIQKRAWWFRALSFVGLGLILNLLVLANSRGATVGLAVATLSAVVLARRGLRKRIFLGAAFGVAALLFLADPEFITRQRTIVDADDGSAQTRFALWRGSAQMIKDHPFGLGARGFHVLSPQYVPELKDEGDGEGRSSHNTYIQVAADWGIQGLILFLSFLGYTFLLLHRIRRERSSPDAIYFLSLGLQLGLIGTLTGAYFSVRFYGESIYWFCGMSTALYCMTGNAAAARKPSEAKSDSVAA